MGKNKETNVLDQLDHALNSGLLPKDAMQTGDRLLRRLKIPVSVVIIGMASSGKSQLLNFLAGLKILDPNVKWPVLELAWGKETRVLLTAADGTVQAHPGLDPDPAAIAQATSARIETDLDILKTINILEVPLEGAPIDQMSPIDWAAKRADIALWCTQALSDAEFDLWATVPDNLKDHSFCVLTKADELSKAGILTQQIDAMQEVVSEEFHSLIPLATLQAISSSGPDKIVDEKQLAGSGGKALMSTLLHEAALGRQADVDNVQLFLRRHGVDELGVPAVEKEVQKQILSLEELSESALGFLTEQTGKLPDSVPDDSAEHASEVLDLCLDTVNYMADLFIDQNSTEDEILAVQGDLMDAADVILLLQMEEGVDQAADALTVMLQLKRGMQTKLAA